MQSTNSEYGTPCLAVCHVTFIKVDDPSLFSFYLSFRVGLPKIDY